MAWTEERIELLKTLWGDGQSASQIAKVLGGVTRNAVIGKVHRLGLSNRASHGDAPSKPKVETKPNPGSKKSKSKTVTASAENKSKPALGAAVKGPLSHQIIPADKPLPPQPSTEEINPAALASHREVQKKALRLSLMELTERTCKWPFGDPATDDFSFCGLPVEPGKVYCKPCADIAYQTASARRDRRK